MESEQIPNVRPQATRYNSFTGPLNLTFISSCAVKIAKHMLENGSIKLLVHYIMSLSMVLATLCAKVNSLWYTKQKKNLKFVVT